MWARAAHGVQAKSSLGRRARSSGPNAPAQSRGANWSSVSGVPIELEDVDAWLHGNQEQAQALVRLAPVDAFDAGPVSK
jgi:hypothetical protein